MHFSTLIATSAAAALAAGASAQVLSPNATIAHVQLYGDSGCTNATNSITETALFGGIGLCYYLHYYPAPADTVAIKIDYTDVGTQYNCAFFAFTDGGCRENPTVIDNTSSGVCQSISDVSDDKSALWQTGALICA
ncbi:hypothetical protein EKO27_g12031 [Xylaria grammica]|uniref:AA1-like domain-containing protein n=1 Tax=Xylaria grammica TaxID=363999 RepID=A0A439CLQ9_9PEZI|nr:hypothetical protein F5X98DRAFT_381561 [Xylaria grammica]RWA03074.1 hypothetical protein EKO27_g12031 [Xylaria grammica]GAW23544.1 hypothetical protein ANO14919_131060 [Xylariales sp. No.14919]